MNLKLVFILLLLCSLSKSQTPRDYIKEYSALAIHEMNLYSIPASITLAPDSYTHHRAHETRESI